MRKNVLYVLFVFIAIAMSGCSSTKTQQPSIPVIDVMLTEGVTTRKEVINMFGFEPDRISGGTGSDAKTETLSYTLYRKYPLKIMRITYKRKNFDPYVVLMGWGRHYGEFKATAELEFDVRGRLVSASFSDMYLH